MMAGSDPPSRNGVTYLVAITVLKCITCQVLYDNELPIVPDSKEWNEVDRAKKPFLF
jgi:hypothetical protein